MIVNDPIDRFASNWGIYPTSIALVNDETTRIGATNIEMAGKDWSSEGDFGDGLNGLNDGEPINYPPDTSTSLFDTVHSLFDATSFLIWPIAIYSVYKLLTPKVTGKVEAYKKRRELLAGEREIYKSRRKRVQKSYPIFG